MIHRIRTNRASSPNHPTIGLFLTMMALEWAPGVVHASLIDGEASMSSVAQVWPGSRKTHLAQNPAAGRTILAVFRVGEDRTVIEKTFELPSWQVQFARTLEEARITLRKCAFGAVISESRLADGPGWKDLLAELHCLPDPPQLVVADHLADDRLWAEVLNLGGYDLLTMPLDAREVLRTISLACRCEHDPQPKASQVAGLS